MNHIALYEKFSSPVGTIIISTDGSSVTGVRFSGQRYFESIPDDWIRQPSDPLLLEVVRQLAEYFDSKREAFELPLAPAGTPFQEEVWRALQAVPLGTKVTYAAIAKTIGRPSAVRAVGTAIGRNPVCVIIPCHRVVTTAGGLGGYVAGIGRKRELLRLEGAWAS